MEGPPESVTEAIERARIKAIFREMRLAASHATEQIRIELYATHCLRWILEAFRSHLEASGAGGIEKALRSMKSGVASGIRAGKPDPVRDDTRDELWRYSRFFGVDGGEIIPRQFRPKTTRAQEAPRVFEYPLDLMNVVFPTALSKMVKDIADVTREALRVAYTYENTQNNMGVSFALDSQSADGIAKRILGALDAAHERWIGAAGEMKTALNELQLARTKRPVGGTYARLGGVAGYGHGAATMNARGGGPGKREEMKSDKSLKPAKQEYVPKTERLAISRLIEGVDPENDHWRFELQTKVEEYVDSERQKLLKFADNERRQWMGDFTMEFNKFHLKMNTVDKEFKTFQKRLQAAEEQRREADEEADAILREAEEQRREAEANVHAVLSSLIDAETKLNEFMKSIEDMSRRMQNVSRVAREIFATLLWNGRGYDPEKKVGNVDIKQGGTLLITVKVRFGDPWKYAYVSQLVLDKHGEVTSMSASQKKAETFYFKALEAMLQDERAGGESLKVGDVPGSYITVFRPMEEKKGDRTILVQWECKMLGYQGYHIFHEVPREEDLFCFSRFPRGPSVVLIQ